MSTQPHIKAIARFTRDLLDYDEQLIQFDRTNTQQEDFNTSYIVISNSAISVKQSEGRRFDSVNEIINYNETWAQNVTIEFYGDLAYENAQNFSLLNSSQLAKTLKRNLGLTLRRVSRITDVKKILGGEYGNRVHLDLNVNYSPSIDVETLRIDTANINIIKDN